MDERLTRTTRLLPGEEPFDFIVRVHPGRQS
jgi:hypothetical protein